MDTHHKPCCSLQNSSLDVPNPPVEHHSGVVVKEETMFGVARIREALHRFGPRNPKKTRMAAERPSREVRKEGERKQAERDKEEESKNS